ncbi:MAG: DUF4157 domain-containing protein [Blastocatellia bacterium]
MGDRKLLLQKKESAGKDDLASKAAGSAEARTNTAALSREFPRWNGTARSDIPLTPQNILFLQRTIGNHAVGQLIQAKLTVSQPGDVYEQEADRIAARVMSGTEPANEEEPVQTEPGLQRTENGGGVEASHDVENPLTNGGGGSPLPDDVSAFMGPRFGANFSHVRVHTGGDANQMNRSLNAEAFTHLNNIYFGAGRSPGKDSLTAHELTHVIQQTGGVRAKSISGPHQSESDKSLLSHELAHVSQRNSGVIYRRAATWLERRAWLSFFSHPVPRRLLNNYMDDTGAEVTLSQEEMVGCNPIVDLRRSPAFLQEVASLRAAGGGTRSITVSGWGGALTNGTLGNFTINYNGQLTVSPTGDWSFTGSMDFYDFWDFDPKPFGSGSGRPISAEIKVRVAAAALPGQPFHVRSVQVPVSQSSGDARATWAGGIPTPVTGPAGRTAADIEAGAAGGGPVGGELGAQSSEDLNR